MLDFKRVIMLVMKEVFIQLPRVDAAIVKILKLGLLKDAMTSIDRYEVPNNAFIKNVENFKAKIVGGTAVGGNYVC